MFCLPSGQALCECHKYSTYGELCLVPCIEVSAALNLCYEFVVFHSILLAFNELFYSCLPTFPFSENHDCLGEKVSLKRLLFHERILYEAKCQSPFAQVWLCSPTFPSTC